MQGTELRGRGQRVAGKVSLGGKPCCKVNNSYCRSSSSQTTASPGAKEAANAAAAA